MLLRERRVRSTGTFAGSGHSARGTAPPVWAERNNVLHRRRDVMSLSVAAILRHGGPQPEPITATPSPPPPRFFCNKTFRLGVTTSPCARVPARWLTTAARRHRRVLRGPGPAHAFPTSDVTWLPTTGSSEAHAQLQFYIHTLTVTICRRRAARPARADSTMRTLVKGRGRAGRHPSAH